jgi:hypothetical protein
LIPRCSAAGSFINKTGIEMINLNEIDLAISAHGMWKQRIKSAIETGQSEFNANKVCLDNLCDFGKWLHTLDANIKSTESWKTIQINHAEFHKVAGHILDLALNGKKDEATKGIALGSEYAAVSGKLTMAMMKWKRELS